MNLTKTLAFYRRKAEKMVYYYAEVSPYMTHQECLLYQDILDGGDIPSKVQDGKKAQSAYYFALHNGVANDDDLPLKALAMNSYALSCYLKIINSIDNLIDLANSENPLSQLEKYTSEEIDDYCKEMLFTAKGHLTIRQDYQIAWAKAVYTDLELLTKQIASSLKLDLNLPIQ